MRRVEKQEDNMFITSKDCISLKVTVVTWNVRMIVQLLLNSSFARRPHEDVIDMKEQGTQRYNVGSHGKADTAHESRDKLMEMTACEKI